VVVTDELPGVTRDDVTTSLQEDVLTLEGARQPKTQQQDVNWQRRRSHRTVRRSAHDLTSSGPN
jgi:HSP20 family molecular chaperone IbpA